MTPHTNNTATNDDVGTLTITTIYLDPFGAYLMSQLPILWAYRVQKVFPFTKIIVKTWRLTHVMFNLVKKH